MAFLTGPDFSEHQDSAPALAGHSFAIIRAAIGTTPDRRYRDHMDTLLRWRDAHPEFVTGVYLFGRPTIGHQTMIRRGSPEEQVDAFLSLIRRDAPELVAYDWEEDAYKIGLRDVHDGYPSTNERQRAERASATERPVWGLYGSLGGGGGFPFGDHAPWNWVALPAADTGPAPESAFPQSRVIPGRTFWQYTFRPGDRSRFFGSIEQLHALAGRAPTPAPGPASQEGKVRFIQLSAADLAALPSIDVPAHTPIEDFAGERWDEIGPTKVRVLPGLVDAHSNRRMVVVSTGRFYADHEARPTVQVAVIPKGA